MVSIPRTFDVDLDDDVIRRFKVRDDENDLIINAWNVVCEFSCYGENSRHQVVITYDRRLRLLWPVAITFSVFFILVLSTLIFTGSLIATLCIIIGGTLVALWVLFFEFRLAGELKDSRSPIRIDSLVWEGIRDSIIDSDMSPREKMNDIDRLLSRNSLKGFHLRLYKYLSRNPSVCERMGRGVKGCSCCACFVNHESGVVPAMFGRQDDED